MNHCTELFLLSRISCYYSVTIIISIIFYYICNLAALFNYILLNLNYIAMIFCLKKCYSKIKILLEILKKYVVLTHYF